MRTIYMLGNWKMNQSLSDINSFSEELAVAWTNMPKIAQCGIAPQAMHLSLLREKLPTDLMVGAQTCSEHLSGAFTGELSPEALSELNMSFTLVGHSERRHLYGETDGQINAKIKTALTKNLRVIFCIGEQLEEREAGNTESVLKTQITNGLKDIKPSTHIVIAYEPVWAIGTGKTATPEMAQETHAYVRSVLKEIGFDADSTSNLYGGSVKPDNVEGLLKCKDIDGGLVGGASLKAKDFLALCYAANNA